MENVLRRAVSRGRLTRSILAGRLSSVTFLHQRWQAWDIHRKELMNCAWQYFDRQQLRSGYTQPSSHGDCQGFNFGLSDDVEEKEAALDESDAMSGLTRSGRQRAQKTKATHTCLHLALSLILGLVLVLLARSRLAMSTYRQRVLFQTFAFLHF